MLVGDPAYKFIHVEDFGYVVSYDPRTSFGDFQTMLPVSFCLDEVIGNEHVTYMSSSYRSNRLGLSYWDPYAVHRGGCLELYYCNMVEWFYWDSCMISTTNWFHSVL